MENLDKNTQPTCLIKLYVKKVYFKRKENYFLGKILMFSTIVLNPLMFLS